MEMTDKEIIKKYQDDPTLKNIRIIADLNGTQEYVIKGILDKAGVLLQKGNAGKSKTTRKEVTKKDEEKKVENKIEESPNEKRSERFPIELVPEAVIELTKTRIRENQAKISYHINEIDRLNNENIELRAFVGGDYGDKDRVHGEVQNQQI